MLQQNIKTVARFVLHHTPLYTILEYYNNFRTVYRLQERSQRVIPAAPFLESMKLPMVSLIVYGNGSSERLQSFLNVVLKQLRDDDDLAIIDSPESLANIKIETSSLSPRLFYSSAGQPGKLLNTAIQTSKSSLLVIANANILPENDWLPTLAGLLASHPEVSFVIAPIALPKDHKSFVPSIILGEPKYFSYENLIVRKNAWARAGGFPENLDGETARQMFIARLYDKTEQHLIFDSTLAKLIYTKSWSYVYRKSYQDGMTGLNAESVLEYLRFVLSVVLLNVVSLIFLLVWPLAGLIGLLMGIFIMPIPLGKYVLQEMFPNGKFSLSSFLSAGWLEIVRLLAFALGVTKRTRTMDELNSGFTYQMQKIIAAHPHIAGIVLFSPMVDWSYMFQRYQQMARQFAKHSFLVFYRTDDKLSDEYLGFQQIEPNLFVTSAPLEAFTKISPLYFYINSPWLAPMIDRFSNPIVIYDHCDDIQVSAARVVDHRALLDKAAVVFASSDLLLNEDKRVRSDVRFLPNAVDYDWIMENKPKDGDLPPVDFQPILAKNRPVIGYTGALARWFDYELLSELCAQSPDWEFVLIGSDYDHSLTESTLLRCKNVTWLGLKPYEVLFRYTWRFDVTIIPFLINEVTSATSPIKLFEYFACQKPIVSTDLPECRKFKEVMIASDPATFRSAIQSSLIVCKDPEYIRRISEIARGNTWDARFNALIQTLNQSRQFIGGGN